MVVVPGIIRQHQRVPDNRHGQIQPAPEAVVQRVVVELRTRIKRIFRVITDGMAGDGRAAAE